MLIIVAIVALENLKTVVKIFSTAFILTLKTGTFINMLYTVCLSLVSNIDSFVFTQIEKYKCAIIARSLLLCDN